MEETTKKPFIIKLIKAIFDENLIPVLNHMGEGIKNKTTVDELMQSTDLKRKKVYKVITSLSEWHMVKSDYEQIDSKKWAYYYFLSEDWVTPLQHQLKKHLKELISISKDDLKFFDGNTFMCEIGAGDNCSKLRFSYIDIIELEKCPECGGNFCEVPEKRQTETNDEINTYITLIMGCLNTIQDKEWLQDLIIKPITSKENKEVKRNGNGFKKETIDEIKQAIETKVLISITELCEVLTLTKDRRTLMKYLTFLMENCGLKKIKCTTKLNIKSMYTFVHTDLTFILSAGKNNILEMFLEKEGRSCSFKKMGEILGRNHLTIRNHVRGRQDRSNGQKSLISLGLVEEFNQIILITPQGIDYINNLIDLKNQINK